MKALFLEWKSYGNIHMRTAMERTGIEVCSMEFLHEPADTRRDKELSELLVKKIAETMPDFVFSFDFFPIVAIACQACRVKYISWIYDNPFIQLYSKTIFYDTNYVFEFDRHECDKLRNLGAETIYYLPLAADTSYYDEFSCEKLSKNEAEKYAADISFVGSLYKEKKKSMFYRLKDIDGYLKGYLEGIISSQKLVYGFNFIEESLTDRVVSELQKIVPTDHEIDGFILDAWTYANYFLSQEVTSRDRCEILKKLSENFEGKGCVKLFTDADTKDMPLVSNMGKIDYYDHMPYIFKSSRINLNITLRSIQTGIPLRAFDIMGCGGFLLTNYQADFFDEFVPDEDFVFYESQDDLLKKADYYLEHEDERLQIAKNAYEKVKEFHTYDVRLKTMLEIAFS